MSMPGDNVSRRLIAAALISLASTACTQTTSQSPLAGIDADRVVAIADGDFRASSYFDGKLSADDALFADRLLVWERSSSTPRSFAVSNSVTSPPEVLAVSPDGRYAYVVERLGKRDARMTEIGDLPPGGLLTAVDLAADGPVTSTMRIEGNLEAIDLSDDGRMIAVVSNAIGRPLLHLVPVDGTRFEDPTVVPLADLALRNSPTGTGTPMASAVFWQPGTRNLAVTINTLDRVVMLRTFETVNGARVEPWGPPVDVGSDPFTGRFTPDGRHFLTLEWGRDLDADDLAGRLPTWPSRIGVVRVARSESDRHTYLPGPETDLSSEGIAVSPDGNLVAAISMRGTPFPKSSDRNTPNASVILFSIDPFTGLLTRRDRREFPGLLPEGAAFDRTGRHLLVTAFERTSAEGGAIFVFGISQSPSGVGLEGVNVIPTVHGPHHVVIR
ncbi:hypothetical protein [Qipengyuania qiaonensis]|uniref:Lactonase family protein n=1 Tax=Qipengyuania qiaonensis TaxID=2867240 RepID=A0ABS7JDK8_9SPHN|nr:hypothetical protein [Qipengyuania qiaonensis]MBX7484035.1 hypothetical protein [Qipengyuania qiaonensis]